MSSSNSVWQVKTMEPDWRLPVILENLRERRNRGSWKSNCPSQRRWNGSTKAGRCPCWSAHCDWTHPQFAGPQDFEVLLQAKVPPPFCLPGEGVQEAQWLGREGCDRLNRAEFTALVLSLWELIGHLQKAWEEQLMKRSNSLENCLTLLLYFWNFPPLSQVLLRSWFPQEGSCLGMQWNLWNSEELGRRLFGMRERSGSEYLFRSMVSRDTKSHTWKALHLAPIQCGCSWCFLPHRDLFGFWGP